MSSVNDAALWKPIREHEVSHRSTHTDKVLKKRKNKHHEVSFERRYLLKTAKHGKIISRKCNEVSNRKTIKVKDLKKKNKLQKYNEACSGKRKKKIRQHEVSNKSARFKKRKIGLENISKNTRAKKVQYVQDHNKRSITNQQNELSNKTRGKIDEHNELSSNTCTHTYDVETNHDEVRNKITITQKHENHNRSEICSRTNSNAVRKGRSNNFGIIKWRRETRWRIHAMFIPLFVLNVIGSTDAESKFLLDDEWLLFF